MKGREERGRKKNEISKRRKKEHNRQDEEIEKNKRGRKKKLNGVKEGK